VADEGHEFRSFVRILAELFETRIYLSALPVNAQFGIAYDVDDKNLQSAFRFLFVRHRGMNLGGSCKTLYINFYEKASS
jgi:hypothetical protein